MSRYINGKIAKIIPSIAKNIAHPVNPVYARNPDMPTATAAALHPVKFISPFLFIYITYIWRGTSVLKSIVVPRFLEVFS